MYLQQNRASEQVFYKVIKQIHSWYFYNDCLVGKKGAHVKRSSNLSVTTQ